MPVRSNNIPENLSPLNFQSILIVTYGRTGSTLLQGILNSIDGVVVRGENYNMCYHLFQSYQSILKSKKQIGNSVQNPFYGSDLLDEEYFIKQVKKTVRQLLLSDIDDSKVRSYGFKEIRYGNNLKHLPAFLDFLKKIFPNCCFIFNTRNRNDVIQSWINLKWRKEKEKKEMQKIFQNIENAFHDCAKRNETNSFQITYEDVIGKNDKLIELFSFLGVEYQEEKIDSVLNLRHSHKPSQKHIGKLPFEASENSPFLNKLFGFGKKRK